MEHENDSDINCNWGANKGSQSLKKGRGKVGNWRTNLDHSENSIVTIDLNTEMSPKDLRRQSADSDVKKSQGV